MPHLLSPIPRLVSCGEQGQGLVEYALIIALVAILIITALLAVHGPIVNTFSSIVSGLGAG